MAKRALIVGINAYPSAPLRGCVNDATMISEMLTRQFGFKTTEKRMLTDESATTANIMERLNWLVSGAKPGDFLFFHYSGHGSQMIDSKYDSDEEPDGLDEILCVAPDALVSTDVGLLPAEQLYDRLQRGDIIKANVGADSYKILASYKTTKHQHINITTNGITTSYGEDHPLFVMNNGDVVCKDAKDIVPGDHVVQAFDRWNENYNIDPLWYLIGLFMGDGYFLSNKSIRFHVSSYKEFWLEVEKLAQSIGAETNHYYDVSGYLTIRITHAELIDTIKRMGYVPGQSKRTRSLSSFFVPTQPEKAKGFLRGLYDSNGSSASGIVNFITEDKQVAHTVHILLNSFGVRNSISSGKYFVVNSHTLSANDFINKVGFGIPEKNKKVNTHRHSNSAGRNGEFDITNVIDFSDKWNLKKSDVAVGLGLQTKSYARIDNSKLATKDQFDNLVAWVSNKIRSLSTIVSEGDEVTVDQRRSIGASMSSVSNVTNTHPDTLYYRWSHGNFVDVKQYASQMLDEAESLLKQMSSFDFSAFTLTKVTDVERMTNEIDMYDFTVETAHRFECDGLLVHNCPVDLNWRDKVITDDQLKAIFDKVPAGVHLTVITDCCHSGTILDQANQYQPLGLGEAREFGPDSPNRNRLLPMPADIANRGMGLDLHTRKVPVARDVNTTGMLITGCQSNQTSADAWLNNMYCGAATASLIATLKRYDYNVSYKKLVEEMNDFMVTNRFSQRPELNGSVSHFEEKFLGGKKPEGSVDEEPVVEEVVEPAPVVEIPDNAIVTNETVDAKMDPDTKKKIILIAAVVGAILFAIGSATGIISF